MKTLNPYSLALILSEGTFSCVKASETLGFVSHDALTRQLAKTWTYADVVNWEHLPKNGVLVVDDTVIAKPHSQKIEYVRWTYDSSQNRVCQGVSFFLALWVVDETVYPLAVSLPGTDNRNKLFQALVQNLHEAGFQPEQVLFDGWYASAKTLNKLHRLGWTYVCRIRSNRIFQKKPLSEAVFLGAQGKTGRMKGVCHKIQVVKHHHRYLMTNDLTPHTSQALAAIYQARWVIETVFRTLKTVLHLEKCACRNSDAQLSHILCTLEAYVYLRREFPTHSPEAAQQEMLRQHRCPHCRPDLTQLVTA